MKENDSQIKLTIHDVYTNFTVNPGNAIKNI